MDSSPTSSSASALISKLSNDPWDESALNQSAHSANSCLDNKFSDSMNDDFLMDDLDIEDDFSGLLDLTSDNTFENSTETSKFELPLTREEVPSKRATVERSLSPPPKRRRSVDHTGLHSPMSTCSIRSVSSPPSVSELDLLQSEYKLALQHLALSMRRSEMTRNEIIRQRQIAETQAKLAAAQAKTFTNADRFLSGSTSTLTVGLEQSRSMLKSYMALMERQMA